MSKSKKKRNSNQQRDIATHSHRHVIKAGVYDGNFSSNDFIVSGHSTGSANTEMEALSHQVSIDAGRVPDYPIDDAYISTRARGFGNSADVTGVESQQRGSPSGESPSRTYHRVALWSSLGLASVALGYLAYRFYGRDRGNTEAQFGLSDLATD